ncbi:hypothetical protein GN244_ATG01169 [Phytophthora infestans]|uniref:Transmembrane protein n=1 Tax=Phytophthora infestans TaxID=4787 RepID=A0A833T459_PHYIN|nr:hypothetical protein GN244_ATG01169 [Phytophthora infestans]KAF4133489.1 hypothetical protein GN958_ATG17341 [Phytophthora infestans]
MSPRRRVQPVLTYHTAKEPLSGSGSLRRSFVNVYSDIAAFWRRIQIGHREHYSVERVLAFRDYCERASPVRVFAVCVLTPVPAATVMLLIECVPLKDPELGWKASWTMFIRVFITSIFVGGGIVFLSRAIIQEAEISVSRAIGITIVAAILYTGLSPQRGSSPSRLEWSCWTNQKLQKQLVGHIIGSSAQSLLVVAYPTFNAVFLQLSGRQQAVFMLVLPVIKFITKQFIAKVATYLHDYIGALIIFSVNVFNVLYVAICMQTDW